MSDRISPDDIPHQPAGKYNRSPGLRRLSAWAGLGLGGLALGLALIVFAFGGVLLNGYGKKKVERMFAEAHPDSRLRIGKLAYSIGSNRLVARSVILSATNYTFKTGRISLTGVRWAQLLREKGDWTDILAQASLEATDLDMEFPGSRYGIRCLRLLASVPGSDLIAEGTKLSPLDGDQEFFAADSFRMTRFHLSLPECRVSGLAYGELLQGKSYHARSVHFSRPSFEALTNRDKPARPFVKSPLMVNEALAAIRQPLQIDSLGITGGYVAFCLRMRAGAAPGVLSFTAVNLSAEGITNRGQPSAAILLQAQGKLMDAGMLKVLMTIPLALDDFSLRYSGSLSAMDLARLNPFLDIVQHTRIKSGRAKEAAFKIDVSSGHARGRVRAVFWDLKIAVLDKRTGTEAGFDNRVASFLANQFKISDSNPPDALGFRKEGKVNYRRRPNDTFLKVVWFALRVGVLDVISR